MKEYNNIFYFDNINSIGGVETFFYYLSKKHKDMAVFYKTGDYNQIKRLAQNVEVRKYNGQKIKCKRLYLNYDLSVINEIEAKEYIQVIHGDYKGLGKRPNTNPKITKYIGVSKLACDSFTELTGLPCECIYNPVYIDKPRKVLRLISATRLTNEKGKDRIIELGNILNKAGIPYVWFIYTNDWNAIKNPNIIYKQPTLNIIDHIADCDYLVQLSSSESFCFSVVESLLVGTHILATDLPVYKELGIENGKHGFLFDLDMSNVDVDKIYKGLPKFTYKQPVDKWDIGEKSNYNANEMVTLIPLKNIDDIETGLHHEKGVPFKTVRWRANHMIDAGVVKEG